MNHQSNPNDSVRKLEDTVQELKKTIQSLKEKDEVFLFNFAKMQNRVLRLERKLKIQSATGDG